MIRVLKYKALWNNKKLIQIDKYYPSSQVCSACEFQNKELNNLSIRKDECPMCHTKHYRDFSASVNISLKV
ncbi:transposase [bacterium]|nr:transposase [bacterium]